MIDRIANSTISDNAIAARIEPSGSASACRRSASFSRRYSVATNAREPNRIMIPKIASTGRPTVMLSANFFIPKYSAAHGSTTSARPAPIASPMVPRRNEAIGRFAKSSGESLLVSSESRPELPELEFESGLDLGMIRLRIERQKKKSLNSSAMKKAPAPSPLWRRRFESVASFSAKALKTSSENGPRDGMKSCGLATRI